MKIAVLVYGLDRIGGINKHTLYLCREFAAMGHQVDICCVDYNRDRCYPDLAQGFAVSALHTTPRPKRAPSRRGSRFGMANYLWTLWNFYHEQQELCALMPPGYDVINPHAHMVNWAAVAYKRRYSTPVVWLCNDFVPIASYNRESIPTGWNKIEHSIKKTLTWPFAHYDRAAVCSVDRIAVLRDLVRAQMMDYYGVSATVVRAGVEAFAFACGDGRTLRARYRIPDKTFLLLTVCVLMPRRRLEDVTRAIRSLLDEGRDVSYLIVGRTSHSPAYAEAVQAEVAAGGLREHVKFAGEIPEQELADCYHACDAFVWASDENQSWGLAGMEAMAAGKPVIVSTANGLAEVLEDGTTALLVAPRCPEAIAEAIRRLMDDAPLAESLAQQGQQLVSEHYSWRKCAEGMLHLFKQARASVNAVAPDVGQG